MKKAHTKPQKECLLDEYCPIYLAYLGKYEKDLKFCKNTNEHYCTKYRLIAPDAWVNMTKDERKDVMKDLKLIEFIENIKDKKDRDAN